MELTQLKYFQTVAKLGSVSKAAEELYVTQPNLSRSIARLEKELGVPLFEHRRGKIVLNEYGRIFLTSVNSSFSELSTGIHTIQRLYDSNQNTLSLGGSVDDILPDILIEFSMKNPEIGIRQFDCSPKEMASRLIAGTLDLGITTANPQDDALTFQVLDEREYVIMVGGRHPMAHRESIRLKELEKERFICSDSRVGIDLLRRICQESGFEPDIAFEVESNHLIFNLLEGNQGIACMPVSHIGKVYRDYPQSNIRVIRIEDELPRARLGILYRRNYIFPNAARMFVEFIYDWLRREDERIERHCGITFQKQERNEKDGIIR